MSGLKGLRKDLVFTQCELRSHCKILNRGVTGSNLHIRSSTLVTVWRINCQGRSREISLGTMAMVQGQMITVQRVTAVKRENLDTVYRRLC